MNAMGRPVSPDRVNQSESLTDWLWLPFSDRHPEACADRRTARGTHALVIGVSAYPVLRRRSVWGLEELSSAATSALRFAEWLNGEFRSGCNAPLRSLRVLLSPSTIEENSLGARLAGVSPAIRDNVRASLLAWIKDCQVVSGSTAVLYAAGHGVFKDRTGSNLLLEDLDGDLDLEKSVDLAAVIEGLGHVGVEASYVFVDACQGKLKATRDYGGSGVRFSYEQTPEQRIGAFVYAAAARGTLAYGVPGKESVFGEALLEALKRDAVVRERDGERRWVVTSHALARSLGDVTRRHPKQHTWPQPAGRELSFHVFDGTPTGKLRIQMRPSDRASDFELSVSDDADNPEVPQSQFDPHPYDVEVAAGVHEIKLHSQPGVEFKPRRHLAAVNPFETFVADFEAQ